MLPVIALPYIFLYLSVTTSPGEITPANLPTELTRYPYDQVLYHSSPVPICSTCNMIKPARSKHCSLCKMCVARADHHCIFINACVGAGNQAYFLLLLVTTALLCICGAALGLPYLADVVRQKYTSFTLWGTGYSWSEYGMFWLWILNKRPAAAGVTILCVMCTPLVAGLGAYSFYLVWAGVTTNESGKWDNVKMDIVEGILWKRVLDARHVEGRMEGVGRLESRWPVRPKVVAVCCDDTPDERFDIGEGAWEKVTDIQELENVYDVGFCDNLRDVFLSRRNLEESWAAGR
jgi:palmitoyltransferase